MNSTPQRCSEHPSRPSARAVPDLFGQTSAPGGRKPMTPAQKAMASKPNLATIRRAAEAMLPADDVVKHREFQHAGWTVSVFDSPYARGFLLVTAVRPKGSPDGEAPVLLSEEVTTQAEADAWISRLTPASGSPK